MAKNIIVTGATGNQGGAVVNQLARNPEFTVLAITRDCTSDAAKKLATKGSNVKVVQADLENVPALYKAASAAAGGPIYGVFTVLLASGSPKAKGMDILAQGTNMIDEALKNGVKHYVFSSNERGGDEASWNNEVAQVVDYATKHKIEHHLKNKAQGTEMHWTVLRPTALMDNMKPEMKSKVFVSALKGSLKDLKMQWCASSDIGRFARLAFEEPDEYNQKALGLVGDELSVEDLIKVIKTKSGVAMEPKFGGAISFMLKSILAQLGNMLEWFRTNGTKASISRCRQLNPGMLTFEAWMDQDSEFPKKK